MTSPRSRKSSGFDVARWFIYILLSLLTIMSGVIFILSERSEIGISLLSGGIASALFVVQKIIDDVSVNGRERKVDRYFSDNADRINNLEKEIRVISSDLSGISSRVGDGADERCIQSRHLKGESEAEVSRCHPNQTLEIDAIGISLRQFFNDHEKLLCDRRLLRARIVIADPTDPSFNSNILQEGRSPESMSAQIYQTLERFEKIKNIRSEADLPTEIELRLLPGAMTTTGIRIGSTWFFRPRFQNEADSHQFFFERYDATSPGVFGMVCAHFLFIWEDGKPGSEFMSNAK